jgi:hypothetical protein
MPFILFKFLHVLTMFAAVAVAVFPEVIFHRIARSHDVRTIRVVSSILQRVGKFTPVFFVAGAVFGLLAAATGQLNFLAPWLIASYVVFVIAMVTGIVVADPWASRVAALAGESDVERPSSALLEAIHDRRGVVGSAILMTSIVVLVFLMVVKPGA